MRPSLCLEALSSLFEEETAEDTALLGHSGGPQLRPPFAGGASSFKGGFAFNTFMENQKAAKNESQTQTLPLAVRLGVSEEDLNALLTDPRYSMPRADGVPIGAKHDNDVLDSVEVLWRTAPTHSTEGTAPQHDASLQEMPFINRPVPTEAPEMHSRQMDPLIGPTPLRFRDMLKDPRREAHMADWLRRLQEALVQGRKIKPFILRQEELKAEFQEGPYDISDLDNVRLLDDSDVDISHLRRDVAAIEDLLPDHCDRATMWSLRYGIPSHIDEDMPIAIFLSLPNASAMPHLERLAKMDDETIQMGWARELTGVPSFPFSAHPYGMVVKYTEEKVKYRESSDYSGPRLNGEDDSFAINDHVAPDDVHLTSMRSLSTIQGEAEH